MARRRTEAVEGDVVVALVENRARPRGRPRLAIDPDAVADAVAELFAKGGSEAVSIVSVADKLEVSRATLYRTVPTKEDLIGILFERSTLELTNDAVAIMADGRDVRQRLHGLVALQVDAAVRMRQYMPVFFGGAGFAPEVFERWHSWSKEYEQLWAQCVEHAMEEEVLESANVVATTRLILGMCIWVSRWYRPNEDISTAEITQSAIKLLPSAS
ncbi:TetR/AcrR family transcriptional regulator [Mycolicibacterium hodleri]|uniref:TetR/AcrR family transcriptional regulator n=1 Tax=Mycolicibacterium hodleri TaxID=49897 RepID=A0A502E4Y3_9MYCO|nr:TetR/AcrR family transcriptional regulator [Mycolicibacterium hodleri]TPG32404.1 TetR/AcrR family transcriptional regulator [Mycolicibacterium hodleri]